MAIERQFVQEGIKRLQITQFMQSELRRSGYAGIDIQRTPLGTRIMVYAERPGMVIGGRGRNIQKLTKIAEKELGITNPQIEVKEVEVAELNPQIMTYRLARLLERGIHFRRAAYSILRRIMDANARGAEIIISGKLTGDRSRTAKFSQGVIKHCGEPALTLMEEGFAQAYPKQGVIGVKIRIMPPTAVLPDEIRIEKEEKKEKIEKDIIEEPEIEKTLEEEEEILEKPELDEEIVGDEE